MTEETTVVKTPEGAGSVPTTETTPEVVTSPEVKTEPEVTPVKDVDAKMQGQIDNLNIALKQERDANKASSGSLTELKEELETSRETIDKLKNVFSPEQQPEVQPENVSMDQLEELLDRRDTQRQEETKKETQAQAIKTEVSVLEKEWNGESGKPKYDDKKVLDWQEVNSKLHLSPKEAFNEMSRDTIIDWEIKNRMAKKPEIQNVMTPGGTPTTREPQAATPQTDEELRSAVLEAIDNVSDENIN